MLAAEAVPGMVITLNGDLGTGKTVFAQGFAAGLGVQDYINSPTFTMNAIVDDLIMGTGTGSSKKQAEQNAAKNAFEKLVK